MSSLNASLVANGGDGSGFTNLNASALTSGTLPDARFPATLPAASGANLTALPGANVTGTVPLATSASACSGNAATATLAATATAAIALSPVASGDTASTASNVFVTIFTPTVPGDYKVYAYLPGVSASYNSIGDVTYDGAAVNLFNQANGTLVVLQLSGNAVQAKQVSGSSAAIRYFVTKVTG